MVPLRPLKNHSQRIFAAIFKNQLDCLRQILSAFLYGAALSVSSRYLRTISNEPISILLYDSSELIMHSTTSILRIGVIHFRSGAIARLERAVHPPVPRGCMLSREVDSTFRALCYRKQRRHLARLKISERAARKRVLMPDVT